MRYLPAVGSCGVPGITTIGRALLPGRVEARRPRLFGDSEVFTQRRSNQRLRCAWGSRRRPADRNAGRVDNSPKRGRASRQGRLTDGFPARGSWCLRSTVPADDQRAAEKRRPGRAPTSLGGSPHPRTGSSVPGWLLVARRRTRERWRDELLGLSGAGRSGRPRRRIWHGGERDGAPSRPAIAGRTSKVATNSAIHRVESDLLAIHRPSEPGVRRWKGRIVEMIAVSEPWSRRSQRLQPEVAEKG